MKKFIWSIAIFLLIFAIKVSAQTDEINDKQRQTNIITNCNNTITNCQNNISRANAAIAVDDEAIAAYNASNAQVASAVNWNYFVSLEPQIPFATWSKVNSGINWTSIIPTLGINCGGITEANVNWTNWGNCESNGMTPGTSFGGYNTGMAAFWCGNGSISGTC